jgi:hypothetical protein
VVGFELLSSVESVSSIEQLLETGMTVPEDGHSMGEKNALGTIVSSWRKDFRIFFAFEQYLAGRKVKPSAPKLISASPMMRVPPSRVLRSAISPGAAPSIRMTATSFQ